MHLCTIGPRCFPQKKMTTFWSEELLPIFVSRVNGLRLRSKLLHDWSKSSVREIVGSD